MTDRLILGTAIFGMPWYGVTNDHRPTVEESLAILEAAWDAGIRRVDTGEMYGDAALIVQASRLPWVVQTKIRPALVASLYACSLASTTLIHSASLTDTGLLDVLYDLDADIRTGASVYTRDEARAFIEVGASVVQVPYSVLEQECADLVTGDDPAVQIRAPFQQGLLVGCLCPPCPIDLWETRLRYNSLCRQFGLSQVEGAWGFIVATTGPNVPIVFGVATVEQLRETLAAVAHVSAYRVPEAFIDGCRSVGRHAPPSASPKSLWRT